MTLGDVYTDDMIGQKITYESNGQKDWIIFGKDHNGNILLTTQKPIENGYDLQSGPLKWLTYEEDLDTACSIYGGIVQGQEVLARSIDMEDINYVTGFKEPDFSNYTYTFGSENDLESKKINYYYPSLEAANTNYWQDPNKKTTTFQENSYVYLEDLTNGGFNYFGSNTNYEWTPLENINDEKTKYVWGESYAEKFFYLVASRSVNCKALYIDNIDKKRVDFFIAIVQTGEVGAYNYNLCRGYTNNGEDARSYGLQPIRPIVVLPSNLQVKEISDGVYDLI